MADQYELKQVRVYLKEAPPLYSSEEDIREIILDHRAVPATDQGRIGPAQEVGMNL